MNYAEKLKDPRWRSKRKQVLKRDKNRCRICGISGKIKILDVHHRWYYPNKEPWDADIRSLITVCRICHEPKNAPNLNRIIDNMQEIRCIARKLNLLTHFIDENSRYLRRIVKLQQQNMKCYRNIVAWKRNG